MTNKTKRTALLKNSFFMFTVLLLMMGCGGEAEEKRDAEEKREAGSEVATLQQEEEQKTMDEEPQKVPYYRYLTGRISDELDIAMHLHVWTDNQITGYYWYQNVGRPIEVRKSEAKPQNEKVVLIEMDPDRPFDQKISGMFEGDFYYQGLIEGIWSNGDKSINFPFLLNDAKPEDAASISLSEFEYTARDCDNPEDCLTIDITEIRVGGIAEEAAAKINGTMVRDYARFVHSNPDHEPVSDLREAIDSLEYWMEKERAEMDEAYLQNWMFQVSPQVMYNQDNRLCIRVEYYSYVGGAHGNPFTLCYNFDLTSGKKLALSDLFSPSQLETLKVEALRRIKLTYEGSLQDDLTDLGFLISDDEFELGEDFFYSPAGVGIIYSPYEIGPYAMGFVEVFVPFKVLGK